MDQDVFNLGIRKFLKTIGVGSQREIEQAVSDALRQNTLSGNEVLAVAVTLEIPSIGLRVPFDGQIKLN
jgi:hypothetical protein